MSQPVPDLQSKNFSYKSFYNRSVKYGNDIRKLKYVFIWSQIKSFCHKLFLTSYPKTYFTKLSTFDLLNAEMISENWNVCSFGHKLSHFVTTCSWPPIKKLLSQNFLDLFNWIWKKYQKTESWVHLVTNKVISSQHVPELI